MTFKHRVSEMDSPGEANELIPGIVLLPGFNTKRKNSRGVGKLELEQSTREEKAVWHRKPCRPADLSPVFS